MLSSLTLEDQPDLFRSGRVEERTVGGLEEEVDNKNCILSTNMASSDSSASFKFRQKVIFRDPQCESNLWYQGKIMCTINFGHTKMYRVEKFGHAFGEEEDTKTKFSGVLATDFIKPLPNSEFNLVRSLLENYQSPVFRDPHANLYMESDDISVEIPDTLGFEYDEAKIKALIDARRHGHAASTDAKDIVDSLIKDMNVENLKEEADSGNLCAALKLADMVEFLGFRRDLKEEVRKSRNWYCYRMYFVAAFGTQPDLEAWLPMIFSFAYPVGGPEALCALAQFSWRWLCDLARKDGAGVDTASVIEYVKSTDKQGPGIHMRMMIFLYSHAIRRNWVCPHALQIAREMVQSPSFRLDDEMFLLEECIFLFLAAKVQGLHNFIAPCLKRLDIPFKLSIKDISCPTDEQLKIFAPKATEIFLRLPIQPLTSSGFYRSDLHIEYRRFETPPDSLHVCLVNPYSCEIYDCIPVDDILEQTYNSQVTAYAAVWTKLSFRLHMGEDKQGNNRHRPQLITFADRPGDDRQLAAFVENKIGKTCGTKIRIVQTDRYMIEQANSRRTERLSKLMSRIIVNAAKPENQAKDLARKLARQGQAHFDQGLMLLASQAFSEATSLMLESPNFDMDEDFRLLANLFSMRCKLDFESESMSPEIMRRIILAAIRDCKKASEVLDKTYTGRSFLKPMLEHMERQLNRIPFRNEDALRTVDDGNGGVESANNCAGQAEARSQQPSLGFRRRRGNNTNRKSRQRQRRQARQNSLDQEGANEGETAGNIGRDTNVENQTSERLSSFFLGSELTKTQRAAYVCEQEDSCPCCMDRYGIELADTFTAVLHCGHSVCMPCLSGLCKKVEASAETTSLSCPHCRSPVQTDILSLSVAPIVAKCTILQMRVNALPLSEAEGVGITESLLIHHDFDIRKVIRDMDAMLVDHMQQVVRKASNWTPHEKKKIYEEARKALDGLFARYDKLHCRLNGLRDWESKEAVSLLRQLQNHQEVQIPRAREKATIKIWEKMNSAGTMGGENEEGEVEMDFHALHVNEARAQFDLRVMPILKAVKTVVLVVGRGAHSKGKQSKLKPALQKHIDKHEKTVNLRYSGVEGNPGAIRVHWQD